MSAETVEDDPLVRRRGLTRAWYDALVRTGALDGVPVELLEGVLVEVVPQGWEHHSAVTELTRWFVLHVPHPWRVAVTAPVSVTVEGEELTVVLAEVLADVS